ncbi:acyl carrier protein [Micromonospora sp. NPDC050276]|uniref:acyl carrier protein n=1 Tax=Micromonospora sp. NPDC050276 TaxID=3364278 RepID=UPI0037A30511
MDELHDSIRKLLVNDLFVDIPEKEIGADDSLRSVMGLDSLGFVELRVQCEETFGIRISDEEFSPGNFTSVRTVSELVRRLQAARGADA